MTTCARATAIENMETTHSREARREREEILYITLRLTQKGQGVEWAKPVLISGAARPQAMAGRWDREPWRSGHLLRAELLGHDTVGQGLSGVKQHGHAQLPVFADFNTGNVAQFNRIGHSGYGAFFMLKHGKCDMGA